MNTQAVMAFALPGVLVLVPVMLIRPLHIRSRPDSTMPKNCVARPML